MGDIGIIFIIKPINKKYLLMSSWGQIVQNFKENGGTGRTRTADRDFADLGLTTWRRCPV